MWDRKKLRDKLANRQRNKQTLKTDNFGQQKTKVYQQPNADSKAVALLTLNKHKDKNIIKVKSHAN